MSYSRFLSLLNRPQWRATLWVFSAVHVYKRRWRTILFFLPVCCLLAFEIQKQLGRKCPEQTWAYRMLKPQFRPAHLRTASLLKHLFTQHFLLSNNFKRKTTQQKTLEASAVCLKIFLQSAGTKHVVLLKWVLKSQLDPCHDSAVSIQAWWALPIGKRRRCLAKQENEIVPPPRSHWQVNRGKRENLEFSLQFQLAGLHFLVCSSLLGYLMHVHLWTDPI